jgi:hypothetical protein
MLPFSLTFLSFVAKTLFAHLLARFKGEEIYNQTSDSGTDMRTIFPVASVADKNVHNEAHRGILPAFAQLYIFHHCTLQRQFNFEELGNPSLIEK